MAQEEMQAFIRFRFADGHVLTWSVNTEEVRVHFTNWQEALFTLVFRDVVGIEALSIEGEDLSHGTADSTDPFIERACRVARDDTEGFLCFAFWSAWADEPLMRIVARNFSIEDEGE